MQSSAEANKYLCIWTTLFLKPENLEPHLWCHADAQPGVDLLTGINVLTLQIIFVLWLIPNKGNSVKPFKILLHLLFLSLYL